MRNYLFLTIIAFMTVVQSVSAAPYNKEVETLLQRIDTLLVNYETICRQYQQDINDRQAQVKPTSLDEQFANNEQLFHSYQFFFLDSAQHCVDRNIAIAQKRQDPAMIALCHIRQAYMLSAVGSLHDAISEMQQVDRSALKDSLWTEYYDQMLLTYSRYAEYGDFGDKAQMAYYQKEYEYADSTLAVISVNNPYYYVYRAVKLMYEQKYAQGAAELQGYLEADRSSSLANSQMLFMLAAIYRESGQKEKQLECLTRAAIMDLQLSNNDNASLRDLAKLLYELGDNDRAYTYISACMQMASFMNNRVRMVNASEIFGKVQKRNAELKDRRNHQLIVLLWATIIFALMLIASLAYLYRVLRLRSRQRAELRKLNARLQDVIEQLKAQNADKIEHLTFALTLCSDYISKLDQYRKDISRKVKTHMYDALLKQSESSIMVQSELKDFYKTFDIIYLNVYPTFVEDFNRLLQPDQQVKPKEEGRLNTELRIHALLHLGIIDSGKIADFLHCSVQTVYNNRLRTRQKAVDRDNFDEQVRSIGL